ncbi:MAG: hypothetical protein GY820_35975 [Gammaproteobacteria bacterium]|nr:hypothetical protein [Gammaproteobacteria bacterium]
MKDQDEEKRHWLLDDIRLLLVLEGTRQQKRNRNRISTPPTHDHEMMKREENRESV